MERIKSRRMSLPVPCHPGTMVGEYVPLCECMFRIGKHLPAPQERGTRTLFYGRRLGNADLTIHVEPRLP